MNKTLLLCSTHAQRTHARLMYPLAHNTDARNNALRSMHGPCIHPLRKRPLSMSHASFIHAFTHACISTHARNPIRKHAPQALSGGLQGEVATTYTHYSPCTKARTHRALVCHARTHAAMRNHACTAQCKFSSLAQRTHVRLHPRMNGRIKDAPTKRAPSVHPCSERTRQYHHYMRSQSFGMHTHRQLPRTYLSRMHAPHASVAIALTHAARAKAR
eukprot:3925116-Pleurochrysis_carterae.AAC.2